MTAQEIFVAAYRDDTSQLGYSFIRLDLNLGVSWNYRYDTSSNIRPFRPYYTEDASENPYVYIVVDDEFVRNADTSSLRF